MKKRNHLKIVFVFVIFVTLIMLNQNIFAADVEKYQKELEDIKRQMRENDSKLSGVEKEINQYMYELTDLDSKMMTYSAQLAELQGKVDQVNSKISNLEASLQNSAQSYNTAEDMYHARLRVIYENGIPSIIDILFASKGIADFFSRLNIYNSILEYDKSLVGNIQNQKEYIDYIKNDIEVQKLQLEQLTYDTKKSTEALENTISAKEAKRKELENSKSNLEEMQKKLSAQKEQADKKVEEELQKAYEEALRKKQQQQAAANGGNSNIIVSDGSFVWPVAGYYIITTRFNTTYDPFNSGNNYMHYGCDIAGSGILNKPIVAMASGTAQVPPFMQSGYGNYVIVTHDPDADGNIYTSLYGHMSSVAIASGTYVKQGQVLGYVGSTGWSSGPHLHFQVYRNGTTKAKLIDPLSLYPSLKFDYR